MAHNLALISIFQLLLASGNAFNVCTDNAEIMEECLEVCDKANFAPEVVCHTDKDPETGAEVPTCKCGQYGAPEFDISSRMLEDFPEARDRAADTTTEDVKEDKPDKEDEELYEDVMKVLDDVYKKVMSSFGM